MNAMLWIAIGCLIAGLILLNGMWIWQAKAGKRPESLATFLKYKSALQISYFIFFIAAAVCFLIW